MVNNCTFGSSVSNPSGADSHFFSLNSFFLHYRSEAKKTKVKKKTNNPQFDEVFYFEVGASVGRTLSLEHQDWGAGLEPSPPDCGSGAVLAQSKEPQIWVAFDFLRDFLSLGRPKPSVSF